MPEVADFDTQKDWMAACVPVRIEEGDEQDQAVAVCLSIWRDRNKTMDNALKALSRTDTELRVGNYIVLFGTRDLEGHGSKQVNADGSKGEYFSKRTVLDSPYTQAGALYVDFEHGLGELGDELLGVVDWKTARVEDKGVFVERVLNRRNRYVQWVEDLIEQKLIGTSSQAIPEGVKKADDGEILTWPIERDTLSVEPMEYRNMREFGDNVLTAFKALGIPVPVPEHTPEPDTEEAEPEASTLAVSVSAKATVTESNTIVTEITEEVLPMSEEQTQTAPVVDVDALVAEAAEKAANAAVEAYKTKLAAEPATNSGIVVVADETDKKAAAKTWSIGEFLQGVAHEARDVQPFRSTRKDGVEPGSYDFGKAMGQKAVSSLSAARRAKAITGMSELVPADGGFLVGTDQNYSIMGRVYEGGQIIQRVTMTGISPGSNGMTFIANAETSRVAGSRWGGARYYWACEGAEKTASAPTFRRVSLELNKIIGLVYATDELLQDASALEGYIMDVLPQELRVGVQNAFYNGTGAGQPLGILNAPCLVTQAAEVGQAAATIVSENILNMWSRRWLGAGPYVWMINQDILPQLWQMNLGVGTGGMLTFMPAGGLSGLPYSSLMGAELIEVEQCPTLGTVGDIALCAWSEYQAIEKGGVQTASSIHVRFIFDETVFRFVYRVDGQPKWNLPLTPMNSTVTQGPFVVLATRA
jgi:HK97 family phage major capsid protein